MQEQFKPSIFDKATDWVAHFILNHGTLALSGPLKIDANGKNIYINVSNIEESHLSTIDANLGGAGACASGEERILFPIDAIWLRTGKDGSTELCTHYPKTVTTLPTRKSHRATLAKGIVHMGVNDGIYDVLNLSDGGCAFACPDAAAKNWPPGHSLECVLIAKGKLRLKCNVKIVRIQHDLSQASSANALVSCRFTDESLSGLTQALFE